MINNHKFTAQDGRCDGREEARSGVGLMARSCCLWREYKLSHEAECPKTIRKV